MDWRIKLLKVLVFSPPPLAFLIQLNRLHLLSLYSRDVFTVQEQFGGSTTVTDQEAVWFTKVAFIAQEAEDLLMVTDGWGKTRAGFSFRNTRSQASTTDTVDQPATSR